MSPASLSALPAILALSFGASEFFTTIFSGTFEDVSLALGNKFDLLSSNLNGYQSLGLIPFGLIFSLSHLA